MTQTKPLQYLLRLQYTSIVLMLQKPCSHLMRSYNRMLCCQLTFYIRNLVFKNSILDLKLKYQRGREIIFLMSNSDFLPWYFWGTAHLVSLAGLVFKILDFPQNKSTAALNHLLYRFTYLYDSVTHYTS